MESNRRELLTNAAWVGMMAMALCTVSTYADTYVLNSALSGRDDIDWTVASSYTGTYSRDPAASDTVEIPAGMVAKVTAGSTSWTLVNTLTRIVPKDQAVFEVNVPGTYEGRAVLSIPVTEYGISGAKNSGTLRKTGIGALELKSCGNVMNGAAMYDYYLNIAADDGDLYLYREGEVATKEYTFVDIGVAADATLHTCYIGYTRCANLNGDGFVTLDNDTGKEQRLYIYGSGTSSFSGWMTGKIRVDITAGRHDITCPSNTIYTICMSDNAVCGFTRLGANNNVPSSLGTGNFNYGTTSGIIYLGDYIETSSKTFWIHSDTFIDAGAHGGLTLSGKLDSSGSAANLRIFTLTGSNETPCVISGTFPPKADQKNVFYLRKAGTGTWRMADNSARGALGVIDVEEGTLQFDTIAEKGHPCSLGYATNLFEKKVVYYENGVPVDYAMILGDDGTEGTLEYTGSSEAECFTRPIAIRSKGRFVSDSARYVLENVYAQGTGRKTFTLAGASNHGNTAMDIRDGEGTLDVVKDGSGTWTMRGTNTFTGALTAKDGHLAVWNPEKRYTWFRLTAKENGYGCPTYDTTYSAGTNADGTAIAISSVEWSFLQISEVAVYDAEGVNIARGILQDDNHLVFREKDGYSGLKPGQVGVGRDMTIKFNGTRAAGNIQPLDNLFDGSNNVLAGRFSCAEDIGIKIDDESTWVPIVFRLPASVTNTAVAMDILSGRKRSGIGSYNGRNIKSFRFEGSTDGINWDVLFDDKDDLEIPENLPRWFSEPTAYTHGVRKGKGYAFDDDTGLDVDHHQYAFSAVGASGNGVLDVQGDALTVSGLVVNASLSAGTISNVVFAASGTLDVQNADISVGVPLVLPGDYSQLAGVDNIARWSVTMDGEEYRSRKIVVKDGRLILMPKGIGLSFR